MTKRGVCVKLHRSAKIRPTTTGLEPATNASAHTTLWIIGEQHSTIELSGRFGPHRRGIPIVKAVSQLALRRCLGEVSLLHAMVTHKRQGPRLHLYSVKLFLFRNLELPGSCAPIVLGLVPWLRSTKCKNENRALVAQGWAIKATYYLSST